MAQEIILKIEGMVCDHCKMTVEKALKAVPGVTNVTVDLAKKEALVKGCANHDAVVKAVEEAEYTVV